jgi:hypothetical protein
MYGEDESERVKVRDQGGVFWIVARSFGTEG